MKQFPLSPYHQFSNSSLNSDFYDRYLSHDGHQPLQTPLIGIERTQDLLSLKLPPHGPDDQDSQRFPKEWAFEDTTKHDSDRSQSPNSAARLANSACKLTPASDRDKDKIGHSRDHHHQQHPIGIATGAKSKELGLCAPIRGNQLALLSQVRDGGGTQQVELSSGFFFRYNSALSSSSALSKSSCNSNNSDDEAADRQRPANSTSSTSSNSSNSSINNNHNHNHNDGNNYRGGDDDDDDDEDGDNNRSKHDIFAESMKHFNPLKRNRTPENISGASDAVCYDLRSKNSSPDKQQQQQQQHSRRQNGSSSEHGGSDSDNAASSMSQQYHGQESCFGLDPSKQRFQYVLAAPISVATKLNEDTMTYLNQGQAYEIKLGNTTDVAEARKGFMCSIINIGFHERHMQQAENELWQQWSQQHPNEKIFSVDMKLSYNVYGVDSDGLNKYEFLWDSSKAAGVFIRINSISTEFTPKKHGGEKGVPFRLSIETFSYNSKTHDSYFISAASCQIKVFKPKGAERKIRSDRDKIYKRPPSEQEKYHRSCDHTTFSECSLSSLHPMADSSLCYYRHSHGHFASKQVTSSGAVSAGGSSSAGSAAPSSAAPAASQAQGLQNGHSSSSDEELEQRAGQTATTAPPGAGRETDQNNNNSNNSSNHHNNNNNRSSTNHSGEDRDTGSSRPNSPYSQAPAALHHRASTHHHHHHPAHLHYGSSSHLDRELNSSPGQQQQLHASSTGGPNEHDMFNSTAAGMAATNELHHSYPAMYSAAAATVPPPTSHHHQVRSQHSFGHPAMSHYYGHPLPATLVPPHHHHHHHPHMGPAPGYGIAPGPMSHPAAGFALPSAHHAQSHHTLSDVKSSIYRHHQLDSKQPYATAAAAASYGGAASSNMSNNLSLLPHEQQSTTKDHHTSSLASPNNCYLSTNENYNNNNNISTPRHRSASTSLTTATTHCQSYARHHHLDTYFISTTNHSENNLSAQNNHLNSTTNSTNANTNSSSSSNNNNNLHNQWGAQQQSSATATNHQNNRSDAIFGYTDCGNLQASESPSSCCSRYQNGSINQTYASQSTDESVADIKQPPSSAHITVNSSCIEVVSWFASNRFGALAKIFNNFSGADLLRLCKTELIEICGLTEGIRLYNSLHNRPIKPRRVLYICLETDDIYHPIYLYDLSLSELLGEISLILETNSKAIDDNDEDCVNPSHNSSQTGSSKTVLDRTGSTSSSSSDSRSSSRPLSAETNDDEVYQSEQYFESDMHGSLSQGHDQSSEKSSSLQISRLLVDGVASVKVVATEKVVQMLEDESVWTLSVKTRLSGTVEACITACRQSHKRHCK